MDLTEKTLESKTIFEGKILTVQLDKARLPDGSVAGREVCRHPGGVAVLPLEEDGTVSGCAAGDNKSVWGAKYE